MTFIHKGWTGKRDYETTNVVVAEADHQLGDAWRQCERQDFEAIIDRGASQLWIQGDVRHFGWL